MIDSSDAEKGSSNQEQSNVWKRSVKMKLRSWLGFHEITVMTQSQRSLKTGVNTMSLNLDDLRTCVVHTCHVHSK